MKYYFRCPRCGNDEEFLRPSDDTNTGCSLLFFGGLFSALIFSNYQKQRVQCLKCMHMFQQPPVPSSPVENFAGVVQAITLVLVATAVAFYGIPVLTEVLPPGVPIMSAIEDAVANQPRTAAYLLVALVVSMLGVSVIAALLGKRGTRRRLSSEYRLQPPRSIEVAGQGEMQSAPRRNEE